MRCLFVSSFVMLLLASTRGVHSFNNIFQPIDQNDIGDIIPTINAQDVGDIHNRIVSQVHNRISAKTPRDSDEYSNIVLEEMLTLCDDYGDECVEFVKKLSRQAKDDVRLTRNVGPHERIESILPKDTNAKTKTVIKDILDAVSRVDDDPLEWVLTEIEDISLKAFLRDDISDDDKVGIQVVASVAMRSSEYWKQALGDVDNSFYQLYAKNKDSERHLQGGDNETDTVDVVLDFLVNAAPIILADVVGAIQGFFVQTILLGILFVVTFGFFGNPLFILFGVLITATIASLEAIGLYFPDPILLFTCIVISIVDNNCNITDLFPPLITDNVGPFSEFVWETATSLYNITVEDIIPAVTEAVPVVMDVIYKGWLFLVNIFYPDLNEGGTGDNVNRKLLLSRME